MTTIIPPSDDLLPEHCGCQPAYCCSPSTQSHGILQRRAGSRQLIGCTVSAPPPDLPRPWPAPAGGEGALNSPGDTSAAGRARRLPPRSSTGSSCSGGARLLAAAPFLHWQQLQRRSWSPRTDLALRQRRVDRLFTGADWREARLERANDPRQPAWPWWRSTTHVCSSLEKWRSSRPPGS